MGNRLSRNTICLVSIEVAGLPISTFHCKAKQKEFPCFIHQLEQWVKHTWKTDKNIDPYSISDDAYMCKFEIESTEYDISVVHYEYSRLPIEMKSLALKVFIETTKSFPKINIISI